VMGFVAELDLVSLAVPGCFMVRTDGENLNELARWVNTMCWPLLLMGLLGACSVVACLPAACCQRCGVQRLAKCKAKVDGLATGIFLLTYILMASQAASPYDCVEAPDGLLYMREVPSIECTYNPKDKTNPDGSYAHGVYLVPGTAVLFSCVAAIAVIYTILRTKREELHSNPLTLSTYGTLYLRYEPERYYWEVWILTRKLAIVVVQRMLRAEGQIACSALVLLAALALQHRCKPFISDSLDLLEESVLVSCTVLVLLGAYSFVGGAHNVTTALYFATIALTCARVAQLLRRIWAGEIVQHTASQRAKQPHAAGDAALRVAHHQRQRRQRRQRAEGAGVAEVVEAAEGGSCGTAAQDVVADVHAKKVLV
jgi:hypothetical protein